MKEFFIVFLNKMEIYTGMKQLEKLKDKREMLEELINECAKAANQFHLKEDITKKVLFDAMQTDQDFIGLNVKWVRKVLNLYCQVHGVTKENAREEVVDLRAAYQRMIDFWDDRKDLDPDGERKNCAIENYKRVVEGHDPISDLKAIDILAGMHSKQIAGMKIETVENPKGSGTRLRENIEKNSPPKLFTFEDGFSCYAGTQEEALEIYKQVKV
jgi:hypothetical protein